MMAEITDPTAVSAVATDAIAVAPAPATAWFADWANLQGIQEFARLIEQAELTSFIESCETPLTIFVPTNEAIRAMAGTLPTEIQLLRELLCVHITMGSLRWASDRGSYLSGGAYPRPHPFSPHTPSLPPLARRSREELHTNRSITTIGQQTHHVQAPVEGLHQPLQVGTMKLVSADIVGSRYSSIVDSLMTMKVGPLLKILAWYDNEAGYATRLVDLAALVAKHGA